MRNWVTSFDFAHEAGGPKRHTTMCVTIVVELPAGFDASNTAVPTCTQAQLLAEHRARCTQLPDCPIASQVGQISIEISTESF